MKKLGMVSMLHWAETRGYQLQAAFEPYRRIAVSLVPILVVAGWADPEALIVMAPDAAKHAKELLLRNRVSAT